MSAMQPWPPADHQREGRIVEDVAALLHEDPPGEQTVRKIRRWIRLVLDDANWRRRWWFLENVAEATLEAGQDVIDFSGHIDRVVAAYAPRGLWFLSLAHVTALRMSAAADHRPNAGAVTHYALEAGRRLHLWPAPKEQTHFAVLYTRPMHVAIVPPEWEGLILDGVLGRFGRHFDRDALSQDPEAFEARYERDLRLAATHHWGPERVYRWDDMLPVGSRQAALSDTNSATEMIAPASLTGIGFVTIETPPYPMEVA